MIVDLYSKNPEDFDFDPSVIEITDELKAYHQSIRNVLTSKTGQIFGGEDMPVDLESYVYSMGLNNQQIRELVIEKIKRFCPLYTKFETVVEVKFGKGDVREICWIDFVIDGSKLTSFLIK